VADEVLQTQRLILRELVPQDLDALHQVLGDPETMRFYDHPFSRDETTLWIERNRERYDEYGFGLWGLELVETGTLVGDCGLTMQRVDGRLDVEVGYHVNRAYWRRGLATEAAIACRDHAFGVLGLDRLIAIILPENAPSQGVARKLGMEVEKEADHGGRRHLVFAMRKPV
jgi:ribosomal-protein-alanine N-acetyltransferase